MNRRLPPPLPSDTVVGERYRVTGALGAGGMARVYAAIDTVLSREVALKILPASDDGTLDLRFRREARNGARLDHPNCARVHDFGRDRHGHFLVMERLQGPTLRDEFAYTRPGIDHALAIVTSLLRGLAHAHERGVLHRDIKPENVMRRADMGTAVLIDFGLSSLSGDDPLTAAGSCVGSPTYLAPERLREQPYDERADLYAVGVVLFELLTGRPPFAAANPNEVARMHLREAPPPLCSLRPDASPALASLVHRCLAKLPDERIGSASALIHALRATQEEPSWLATAADPIDDVVSLRPRSVFGRALGWLVG